MSRKLIPNVPFITMSTDDYAYLTSFTGALYGALKSIGESYTNAELLALSGFGNRLVWTEGKWIFGNEDIENCNRHPFEIQDRLLRAIGWKAKRISIQRGAQNCPLNISEDQIRQDFVDSLDKGIPVLAQGITDDGCKHDYNIFYGYEDNGRKIIGWDYYQQNDQPFIRENWEKEIAGYVLLKEKTEAEPERERVMAAFRTIAGHVQTDELRGKKLGLAAWQSLMDHLEFDDFSQCPLHPSPEAPDDENGVKSLELRFIIYCDALTQINQRGLILPYYRDLVRKFPEWSQELNTAIAAWQECAGYASFLWSQGFAFDEKGFERFRDPMIRKILADEGRKAMQKDLEAAKQIETILRREDIAV